MKNDVIFKRDDMEIDLYSNPYKKARTDFSVSFEYQTHNIEVESEVVLVEFNDFVSSVGGALGLFLGFSLIDTIFYVFDYICKKHFLHESSEQSNSAPIPIPNKSTSVVPLTLASDK